MSHFPCTHITGSSPWSDFLLLPLLWNYNFIHPTHKLRSMFSPTVSLSYHLFLFSHIGHFEQFYLCVAKDSQMCLPEHVAMHCNPGQKATLHTGGLKAPHIPHRLHRVNLQVDVFNNLPQQSCDMIAVTCNLSGIV